MEINWNELDECVTPDEIMELLKQRGVRGIKGNAQYCPLACATGWTVFSERAYGSTSKRILTRAETMFVLNFDNGKYPELEKIDARKS